jgi:broad specificity phosphatase PhoE
MTAQPTSTIIDIFRHAQSESNAGLATLHPVTTKLTALGEQQAKALAASFNAATPPQTIIVTPYHRTGATAAPTLERFAGAKYLVWEGHEFTYLDVTKYDGLTREDRRPAARAYWTRLDPDYVDGVGAESFNHMAQRMRGVLQGFARLPAGYHMSVNHGFTMQAMWVMLTQPELEGKALMAAVREYQNQDPVPNVGCMRVIAENGQLRLASDWKTTAMCA